jgi:cell division protein FtsZ
MFESIVPEAPTPFGARIKVIGVGGGGGNAVNNMIAENLNQVEYIVANTDVQALGRNRAPTRLQIGPLLTRGLGAGGNPDTGHRAALEDIDAVQEVMADCDMVFITAGMGGGTGTGAAPVIAQAARAAGALTVAVVTRPFAFEGANRTRQADEGLRELADSVDTLIVIPNDRILDVADRRTSFRDAFKLVDSVVVEAVRGISDIIQTPGLINVDFADVVAIMKGRGMALMGTGRASGEDRARVAARLAISSPLLEDARIEGATGLLVSITGSADLSLADISDAMTLIQESASADTNTIFGAVIDETMGDEIKVTVVATGFDRIAQAHAHELSHTRPMNAVSRPVAVPPPTRPLSAVPPPPPPIAEPVRVYVAASAEASIAGPLVPPPQPGPRTTGGWPALPMNDEELDQPSYVRRATPAQGVASATQYPPRREPLINNPFQGQGGDVDRPAFMRK